MPCPAQLPTRRYPQGCLGPGVQKVIIRMSVRAPTRHTCLRGLQCLVVRGWGGHLCAPVLVPLPTGVFLESESCMCP